MTASPRPHPGSFSPDVPKRHALVHRTSETHIVWPALAFDLCVVSPRQITNMPVSRRLGLEHDHPPSHYASIGYAFHRYGELGGDKRLLSSE